MKKSSTFTYECDSCGKEFTVVREHAFFIDYGYERSFYVGKVKNRSTLAMPILKVSIVDMIKDHEITLCNDCKRKVIEELKMQIHMLPYLQDEI